MVDADRVELGFYRRYAHHHVLDHRSRLRGRRDVHGLLRPPFRHGSGEKPHYEPENKKLEWALTIATAVGVFAMLAPGLFVWRSSSPSRRMRPRSRSSAGNGPGASVCPARTAASASDTRNVSAENPLGINPNDPRSKDDVVIESDDLHLQIGKPVKVLLRSVDVLHFYVPEFRGQDGYGARVGDMCS